MVEHNKNHICKSVNQMCDPWKYDGNIKDSKFVEIETGRLLIIKTKYLEQSTLAGESRLIPKLRALDRG